MTGKKAVWAVVEFDVDRAVVWSSGPYSEAEARERFEHVLSGRTQRSDVVLRTRSAALQRDGQLVEAASTRRSRRAPAFGSQRLRHLDPDLRDRVMGLELVATRVLWASLRKDGAPRVGPGWRVARAAAREILDLVRGASSADDVDGGWWLQEWDCRCTQVERVRDNLRRVCPYHSAPRAHGPEFVEA